GSFICVPLFGGIIIDNQNSGSSIWVNPRALSVGTDKPIGRKAVSRQIFFHFSDQEPVSLQTTKLNHSIEIFCSIFISWQEVPWMADPTRCDYRAGGFAGCTWIDLERNRTANRRRKNGYGGTCAGNVRPFRLFRGI